MDLSKGQGRRTINNYTSKETNRIWERQQQDTNKRVSLGNSRRVERAGPGGFVKEGAFVLGLECQR